MGINYSRTDENHKDLTEPLNLSLSKEQKAQLDHQLAKKGQVREKMRVVMLTLANPSGPNFSDFITILISLGVDLQAISETQKLKNEQHQPQVDDLIRQHLKNAFPKGIQMSDDQRIAFHAFMTAWEDQGLESTNGQDKRYLKVKAHLSKSLRHQIKLSLLALNTCFSQAEMTKKDKKFTQADIKQLDEKACAAIRDYRTATQSILIALGQFSVAITAFVVGFVETGTAVFMLLQPYNLAVLMIYSLAALASMAAAYAKWTTYKHYVSSSFLNILGQDEFCDGLTSYINEKDGKKQSLSLSEKIALAVFSFLAILTGGAIGALGYTSALSFLALWGVSAVSAVPIAVGITVVVALVHMTAFIKTFSNFLGKQDRWSALFKPLTEISEFFAAQEREGKKGKVELFFQKAITYVGVAAFSAIGMLGLAMTCYACTQSVGVFVAKSFDFNPAIAKGVGIFVGGFAAFVSRTVFTYKAMSGAVSKFFHELFSPEKTVLEKASWFFGSFLTKEVASGVLNAVTEGIFFFESGKGLSSGEDFLGSTAAGLKSLGTVADHWDGMHEDPAAKEKEQAEEARVVASRDYAKSLGLFSEEVEVKGSKVPVDTFTTGYRFNPASSKK